MHRSDTGSPVRGEDSASHTRVPMSLARTPVPALFVLLAACTSGEALPEIEVVATVDEAIPTVVTLAWEPPAEGEVRVEFGPDTDYGDLAWPTEENPGRAVLTGSLPDSDVHFRLVVTLDGRDHPLSDHVVRTGSLSDQVPEIEVVVDEDEPGWGRYVLLPLFDAARNTTHVMLLNGDGQPVWWHAEPGFVPAVYPSKLDGSLLYRLDGWVDPDPNGRVVRMDWQGAVISTVEDDMGHHDFVEHNDGTIATLEMTVREVDGESFVGDRIIEHPLQGEPRVIWDAFETLEPKNPDEVGADLNPYGIDWTHANSIDYEPVTDRYLVSLYYLREVLAIDRATGKIDWILGGGQSDFALSEPEAFAPQHAASWVAGRVMLFDNHDNKGVSDPTVQSSRAVRYALDEATGEAEMVGQWIPADGLHTAILGDARLLPGGAWYVSAGALGIAQVIDPTGRVVWQVQAPPAVMIGRGAVLDNAPSFEGSLTD